MDKNFRNKIYGAFFGQAIGDALGLGTEHMTLNEISRHYPDGLSDYSQIIRDSHRSLFEQGEWTNDFEVALRLAHTMLRHRGVNREAVIDMLCDWFAGHPRDLVSNFRWVLSDPGFHDDPEATARKVWKEMGGEMASNECITRCVMVGLWPEDTEENSAMVCRLTHYDPRCVGSCVITSELARSLMWDDALPPVEKLEGYCNKYDDRITDFLRAGLNGDFDWLNIDDRDTYWYTRKCMATAVWAAYRAESFEEALLKIISLGGDADTNAEAAVGVAGIRFGYDNIPRKYIDGLRNTHRITECADRFMELLQEKFITQEVAADR